MLKLERGESHLYCFYILKQVYLTSPDVDRQDLNNVVLSLAKAYRDAKQQLKGGSVQISVKQLNNRIGIKPSLADCLEGLRILHEMYQSEYECTLFSINLACEAYHITL